MTILASPSIATTRPDHAPATPAPTTPAPATPTTNVEPAWVAVCPYDRLLVGRGVAALVGGRQVAVFLLADGSLHAIGNRDPYSGANVLSRGLTADIGGEPAVASPVYKQRFSLRTGRALDDPTVAVPVHAVRCEADHVEVRLAG